MGIVLYKLHKYFTKEGKGEYDNSIYDDNEYVVPVMIVQKMYGDGFSKYYLCKKYFGVWIRVYSSFDREECIKQSNILKRKVILTGVEVL